MNILTGQRTYFIGLSSTGFQAQTLSIPFTDTSGNIIKCNYFKVEATNNDQAALNTSLVAEPSGVSMAGTLVSNNITQITKFYTTLNGSGICGAGTIFGAGDKGSIEWHGSNGEVCRGIRLKYEGNITTASTIVIGITYGNLIPYNNIRGNRNLGADGSRGSSYDIGV